MNKFSFAPIVLVVAALLSNSASAQWNYGQDSTYNSIESRIDIRKTRARIKARQAAKAKAGKAGRKTSKTRTTKTVRKTSTQTSAPAKKVAASLPSHVEFYRDTYQDFHLDDSKGYIVNFVFTSTSGKVMRKSYTFNYYDSVARFSDIPIGKYRVVAEAVYGGKKYPVQLGSEDGTSTNPEGGNFAPSINIEVKMGKDSYGDNSLLTLPETLHVRVIEGKL